MLCTVRLLGFFDVRLPHLGLGAGFPPVPTECLRSDVVARNEHPSAKGTGVPPPLGSATCSIPVAASAGMHLASAATTLVAQAAPAVASPWRGSQGWGSASDEGENYQGTGSSSQRRPTPWTSCSSQPPPPPDDGVPTTRLSACHQVFSRPLRRMPTVHSLASAQSPARCVFVWTTLSRVTRKMAATGSTPGAPSCPGSASRLATSFLPFCRSGNGHRVLEQ